MRIELVHATAQHRRLVRQLYELYCHDFSPMTSSEIGDDGYWTGDDFLTPWPGDQLQIFLMRVDDQWAGFAWIARGSYLNPVIENHYLMDEFFIMRKYRRQGLGEQVAVRLFNKFEGVWEVGEIQENVEAQVFWRLVIGRYTDHHFQEINADTERWLGPVQTFRTP
ncbi:MAG: GNAT family N-acetyltransferase [Chloroflexi bacterium]|nr:GNAT family N-acetyltransferase [Chloroflexota bacterium]